MIQDLITKFNATEVSSVSDGVYRTVVVDFPGYPAREAFIRELVRRADWERGEGACLSVFIPLF